MIFFHRIFDLMYFLEFTKISDPKRQIIIKNKKLNNIIVALAWFGVNLLSVGLHSYGFASGIALNLGLFILFELLFGISAYSWLIYKQKQLPIKNKE